MGSSFGPYELQELLGRGGMGEVWRARDLRKDRIVALKVLGSWLGADEDYVRRFRREAAAVAKVSAPNIIPIHDYGEIDGRLFIDMALIDGRDLAQLLAGSPFAPARAVAIIEQVADGLDAAHGVGVIHRDVKPSNVLVHSTASGRDTAYLIDFGIAHTAEGTTSVAGGIVGSLAYMAPERFYGAGDVRSDVYALAAVLYETLTGKQPYSLPDGAHPLGFYLSAHRTQPVPRPSALVGEVPRALDDVIARGMAKRPEDRYSSAGEFAVAAARAVAATPGEAGAVGRRRGRLVGAAAVLAAAAVSIGAFATWGSGPPDVTADPAPGSTASAAPPRPTAAATVSSVDWRNHTYQLTCDGLAENGFTEAGRENDGLVVPLIDGRAAIRSDAAPDGLFDIKYRVAAYGDVTGDGRPETAVLLSCTPRGANYFVDEVQVFGPDNVLLAELPSPKSIRREGEPVAPEYVPTELRVEGGNLVAGMSSYPVGGSHADGATMPRTVVWHWTGSLFENVSG